MHSGYTKFDSQNLICDEFVKRFKGKLGCQNMNPRRYWDV